MRRTLILMAAGLLFLAVACESGGETQTQTVTEPETLPVDAKWILEEIRYEKEITLSENPDRRPDLALVGGDNMAFGFGGCNRFMGSFSLGEDRSIRFAQLASTKMMCEQMEIEDGYYALLDRVRKWQIDGGNLILKDEDGEVLLTYFRSDEELDIQ